VGPAHVAAGGSSHAKIGIAHRVAVAKPKSKHHSGGANPAAGGAAGTAAPRPASGPAAPPEPPQPPDPPPAACTTMVSSLTAAVNAVAGSAGGAVVCLADGSYGEANLSASPSGRVTLRAEHPGQATIAGATIAGRNLTLERFAVAGEVQVEPSSTAMRVAHNRISGGYFGVEAAPTSTVSVNDVEIVGNKLVGPFGEDAIHLNRYHDSNGDGIGALVEGNEISGVRENGNHSDCLQTVWVGDHLVFRRNYLHDNRCQGFFVKDQASPVVGITVVDNLLVRNNEPCAPEDPGCGQPAYFQVFGPYQGFTMRRNTIWQGDVTTAFQEGTGTDTRIEDNVVNRFWTSTDLSLITYLDNTRCVREASGGLWPLAVPGETVDCSPPFNSPASDDFRLLGSNRGVDWAPAEVHFGP
jgi:Right handed beta helix region